MEETRIWSTFFPTPDNIKPFLLSMVIIHIHIYCFVWIWQGHFVRWVRDDARSGLKQDLAVTSLHWQMKPQPLCMADWRRSQHHIAYPITVCKSTAIKMEWPIRVRELNLGSWNELACLPACHSYVSVRGEAASAEERPGKQLFWAELLCFWWGCSTQCVVSTFS